MNCVSLQSYLKKQLSAMSYEPKYKSIYCTNIIIIILVHNIYSRNYYTIKYLFQGLHWYNNKGESEMFKDVQIKYYSSIFHICQFASIIRGLLKSREESSTGKFNLLLLQLLQLRQRVIGLVDNIWMAFCISIMMMILRTYYRRLNIFEENNNITRSAGATENKYTFLYIITL